MKRITQIAGYAAVGALIVVIATSRTTQQRVQIQTYTAEVEQGPAWLINILYNPNDWVMPALLVAVLFVIGLGYVGYERSGVTTDVQREMVENVLILIFAGAITLGMVSFLSFSYPVDVLTGGISGFVIARALSSKYVYPS